MRRRAILSCAAVWFTAAPAPTQIFTADAGVASPELPSIRGIASILRTSTVDEARYTTDFGFSPRTNLELRLRVPVVYRAVDFTFPGGAGRAEGSLFGLGDLEVRAKYALVRRDDVMRSDRLSLLGSVILPTAGHDERVDGLELPRRLQLGLGTFGFAPGAAYTLVRDRHRASIELGYRLSSIHDGFEPGDEVVTNVAYWFRLAPARFDPDVEESEYRLVCELLGRYRFDDRQLDVDLGNGGTEVWGVLGLQVNLSPNQRLEIGAQLPLFDTMDDALGDREFGAVLAYKVYF